VGRPIKDRARWCCRRGRGWRPRGGRQCPDGSHLSQFDDPQHYFPGLISFLQSL